MKIKAIIEIPKDSKYKYEFKDNRLVLDRVLNQSIPYNYGYIPDTLCEDNDPLDIFIISNKPIPSLTEVTVELIGGFICKDRDQQDDKLIGILVGEDIYPNIVSISQYLKTYKSDFKILDQINVEDSLKVLDNAYKLYKEKL